MSKLGQRRKPAAHAERQPSRHVPSALEADGDAWLAWLEVNDRERLPSNADLARAQLIPTDWVADDAFEDHALYEDLAGRTTHELLAYLERHQPDAIQSERGARFLALMRERQQERAA